MGAYLQALVSINGLPLLSCLAVSGILVYLGMHVVERKVIFVDLALAQIAALGVMWAILMGYDHEHDTLAVSLYSLAFTALGAVIFSITRTRNERVPHEALIGIIYVAASAGGLVLADRFALGTEALKELIAGRVALVTPAIVGKLAITCAVIAAVFAILHRRLLRISSDPAAAEAAGLSIRAWDFLFYMLFGVLITQCVAVLGVLPVFAYLVIPAVTGAFLFSTVRARLLFGWGFAGVISLVGLETARLSQLDPGPTIVCLFALALVLIGVVLFLRAQRFALRSVFRVLGFAALFAVSLGATVLFRKVQTNDELAAALQFAQSGEPTRLRQAMASFRKFPGEQARWAPLVIGAIAHPDRVAREAAVGLLGELRNPSTVPPLAARLASGAEPEDGVREALIRALRAIGEPSAVPALVEAAARDPEPDLTVAMVVAAFELGNSGQDEELKHAAELLVQVIGDDGAPHAAQRDAADALRAHVDLAHQSHDVEEAIAWWRAHRDEATWDVARHRFVISGGAAAATEEPAPSADDAPQHGHP
ncbi:MAG: metal ABC transporter permease [Kofleriaceae bacterium]